VSKGVLSSLGIVKRLKGGRERGERRRRRRREEEMREEQKSREVEQGGRKGKGIKSRWGSPTAPSRTAEPL